MNRTLLPTEHGYFDGRAFDEDDAMNRAFAAYYRRAKREGFIYDQPASSSGVEKVNGKWYAVLHNVTRTLGVYRIRNNGRLKWLQRYPAALNEH